MAEEHFKAFRVWLGAQIMRNDPVGDFARDYLADGCSKGIRTLSSLDRHLREEHHAEDKVLEARDRAWREYRAACP